MAGRLEEVDRPLAARMAGAWFTIVRVASRHEQAGLWLEDMLDGNRRPWIMDEGLEASTPEGIILGLRLFDAGPFHAGFGILVPPDEQTLETCLEARARGGRLPFRHSLAATLYADHLRDMAPPSMADVALLGTMLEILEGERAAAAPERPRKPARRSATGRPAAPRRNR